MNTAIIITAIICGTIVVLGVLNTIDKAIVRKNSPKNFLEALGLTNKEEK